MMWITITIYFDVSHDAIYFLCMLRSNKFNVVNSMFDLDTSLFILRICFLLYIILIVVMLNMRDNIQNYFSSSPDNGEYTEYKVEIQKESEDKDIWRG